MTIATAAWPLGTRDWVWDLAAGAMPTGRNVMLPSSRCLYCAETDDGSAGGTAITPKDSIAHLLQCPRYKQVADWTAKMCESIGAPGLDYNSLIPFGYDAASGSLERGPDTQAAVEAVRGAGDGTTTRPEPPAVHP